MSTLPTILLHLDASPRSATRLLVARELALQHDAAITALYASTPTMLDMPVAFAEGAAGALFALQELDDQRRDSAKALFDRSQSTAAPSMQWRELGSYPLIGGVARHALCADLLVLGQYDGDDPNSVGVPGDFVPSVLIASGRPALVIPYVGEFTTVGRDVLIAWKPTREAAHAASAALPLLRRAQRVHISAETDPDQDADGATIADLERYLRRHGIEAPIERHGSVAPDAPGEGLLSLAADVSADLLVMGCYGHSRARELVLGGASRTIFASMTVPVLMSH